MFTLYSQFQFCLNFSCFICLILYNSTKNPQFLKKIGWESINFEKEKQFSQTLEEVSESLCIFWWKFSLVKTMTHSLTNKVNNLQIIIIKYYCRICPWSHLKNRRRICHHFLRVFWHFWKGQFSHGKNQTKYTEINDDSKVIFGPF